jgi:cell fate regulator YaaT (PSP1 superfamily)
VQQVATSLDSVSLHAEIDDYFQNTSRRASAWQEADRNLQLQQQRPADDSPHTWPLYVVEFKAGRKDFFYLPRTLSLTLRITVGDLVFVDADRGRDLGKVIHDRIFSKDQLDTYRSLHPDALVDAHAKEVVPQRIQKRATTADALPLLAKGEDEAKAVEFCRHKIHHKQLPMQVVDAEYQWDRRKLTFYFISDRRIDFRELVRELFKTYKTRIWMCAVHPALAGGS